MKKASKSIALLFIFIITLFTSINIHSVSAASSYADGEYSIPFTVLKGDNDSASMTNDYITSPGKLIVKNGKNIVQVTLKNNSWWQYFKVNGADVTVLSENSGANTSVVQFEVQNLNQIIPAKIHVIVPDIDYDNKYDVRIKLDASNIPLATNNADKENQSTDSNGNEDAKTSEVGKPTAEKNPPTSDQAPIALFIFILLASGVLLMYQVRKSSNSKQGVK